MDRYKPIEEIEGDVFDVGQHRYHRDVDYDGRFRCIFCGSGYIAIPLDNVECTWCPRKAILIAFKNEGDRAPFMSLKKLDVDLRRLLELTYIWVEKNGMETLTR